MEDKKKISYAKTNEIAEMGLFDTEMGVSLGLCPSEKKPLVSIGPQHVLVLGPTRCGKGQNTVIPSCLSWLDSLVVFDFKGDIWAFTSGFRKNNLKQKVLKFEPLHRGDPSVHWNPLSEIIRDGNQKEKDVRLIVRSLIGDSIADPKRRSLFPAIFRGV